MRQMKVIVEKYPDGDVAYPLGMKGAVVGEGDTYYEEALADVKSAIKSHTETFGEDVIEAEPHVLEAFVAEAGIIPGSRVRPCGRSARKPERPGASSWQPTRRPSEQRHGHVSRSLSR
jgi:hypothetical protein